MELSDFLSMVRTNVLKDIADPDDVDAAVRWSNAELLYGLWMALAEFAQHTAALSSLTVATNGTASTFTLPSDIYDGDPVDQTITVTLESATTIEYLNPINYVERLNTVKERGFSVYPNTSLNTTFIPATGLTLRVKFFAYYENPVADDDLIGVPKWAEGPVAYLTAAHVIAGNALKTSVIRQFAAKPDVGTPDHNPLQKQQAWFLQMYQRGIASHQPQGRVNHVREDS